MELKVDPEFRDLIPPLTEEEYQALEKSLVENGFNPAFRIIVWKGQNIVIDGHNRLGICQRNNIPYEIIEQEFASRYDAMAWIIDNQLARRNINAITRNDLIGRRYTVEKSRWGDLERVKSASHQNDDLGKPKTQTRFKIADQVGVGAATVERAEKLSKAIDIITANTGISRADILSGKIKGTQDEIKQLAEMDVKSQKRAIDLILNHGELSLSLAFSRLIDEERDRLFEEAREKRRQMEEQARVKREEDAASERERLRIAHEERVKQENERLAREREEQEKRRQAILDSEDTEGMIVLPILNQAFLWILIS